MLNRVLISRKRHKNEQNRVRMYQNGNVFLIQFDFGSLRETPVNKGLLLHRNVPNEPNEQKYVY